MSQNSIVCTVCGKDNTALRKRRSKTIGIALYLCQGCYHSRYEPRYAVIMAAKTQGVGSVAEHLRDKLYYGDDILAKELI